MTVLQSAIIACSLCSLRDGCARPVPGIGPLRARVAFVGEHPGREEERDGVPFRGQAGAIFNYLLGTAGLERKSVYITNVVHCTTSSVSDEAASFCGSRWLDAEISASEVIVAMGAPAVRYFLGPEASVEEIHGMPQKAGGKVIFPTYNPAAVLHATGVAKALVQDFRKLRQLLDGTLAEVVDQVPRPWYSTLDDEGWNLFPLSVPNEFALDTETWPGGRIFGFSVSARLGEALFLPWSDYAKKELQKVLNGEYGTGGPPTVWFHNAVFDLLVLRRAGIDTDKITVRDTMVAAYNLELGSQGLKQLARTECGMLMEDFEDVVGEHGDFPTLWEKDRAKAGRYGARDADATLRLAQALKPRLVEEALWRVFELDCATVPYVADLQQTGILLDVPYLEELGIRMKGEVEKAAAKLFEAIGREINPNSWQQLGKVLFDELKMPVVKRTKKTQSRSTDQEAVARLQYSLAGAKEPTRAQRRAQNVLAALSAYRRISKFEGTYVREMPTFADANGWIHPQWKHTRTETGRFAAADPNPMNQPHQDEELAGLIRRAFIAPPGFLFLEADHSQVELRELAHVTQEPKLLEIYRAGNRDIHTEKMLELKLPDRIAAKKVNFGVPYGLSGRGLQVQFLTEADRYVPEEVCQTYIDDYMREHPKVAEAIAAKRAEARATGYARAESGRRRYIPEVFFPDESVREAGERMAFNMPIQGGAHDILRAGMGKMRGAMGPLWMRDVFPCYEGHDALGFYVREEHLISAAQIIKETMETAARISVPLVAEISAGPHWGAVKKLDLKKIGAAV